MIIVLSAYAEYHGLCPWMNAASVSKIFSVYTLMLRRIPLLADNPPKPWYEQAKIQRLWAKAGVLWRYHACVQKRTTACRHGLCPWGSIEVMDSCPGFAEAGFRRDDIFRVSLNFQENRKPS